MLQGMRSEHGDDGVPMRDNYRPPPGMRMRQPDVFVSVAKAKAAPRTDPKAAPRTAQKAAASSVRRGQQASRSQFS